MAIKEVWIGSVGPYLYDDAAFHGIHTDGQLLVETAPTDANHVARQTDVGGLSAIDADYLVKTAHATLSAERVVTDTTTVTWDWATAAQAKANVAQLDTGWGSITNVTPDKAYDADATSVAELADVLGTLIALLVSKGILGS